MAVDTLVMVVEEVLVSVVVFIIVVVLVRTEDVVSVETVVCVEVTVVLVPEALVYRTPRTPTTIIRITITTAATVEKPLLSARMTVRQRITQFIRKEQRQLVA